MAALLAQTTRYHHAVGAPSIQQPIFLILKVLILLGACKLVILGNINKLMAIFVHFATKPVFFVSLQPKIALPAKMFQE